MEKKSKKAIAPAAETKPAEKEAEDVEIVERPAAEVVEKGAYVAKKKPALDDETKKLLALRDEMSRDRIAFLRQSGSLPRLGEKGEGRAACTARCAAIYNTGPTGQHRLPRTAKVRACTP